MFFLQLNINDTRTVNHKYIPCKKLNNPYRIFKVLTKFNEKYRKKLSRFTIKICNYYFGLLFVARKNFFKFDKLLAEMVTKVYP